MAGKALPPLLYFTDPVRTPEPEAVVAALPRGSGVVFRAFGAADALVTGRRLARTARRRGVLFLVGADVALAIALRADGVHFPERLAGRGGRNRRLGRRFILTGAAHGLAAARRASATGLDAIVISSVFASRSPSAGPPIGPRRLASLSRAIPMPIYALGGVNRRSAPRLNGTGAIGLAAIDGLAGD